MRLVLSVLLLGLMAVGFSASPAAIGAGTLSGVVVDAAGAAVPTVPVQLLAGRQVVRETTTNDAGFFRFDSVAPGRYQVRATAPFGTGTLALTVTDAIVPALRVVVSGVSQTTKVRLAAREQAMHPAPPPSPPFATTMPSRIGGVRPMVSMTDVTTESYSKIDEHGFRLVADDPLSTFSFDVDTASYANVRRFLNQGTLPPADAVRIEELLNYFRFDYPEPAGDRPFSVTTDVGPAPWAPAHTLVLVGLKARPIDADRHVPRNLVFLLDVSGSMYSPDKLPLVKTAMRMLTATLTPADRVAIVTYAGASGVALPSTPGSDKTRIEQAIADLAAGGSTNGAAGIQLAYDIAAQSFVRGGINRVILATDGDFNVGVTSEGALVRLIEQQRERGVFLSVLGVGTGNLKDSTMEQLADRGNGHYAYLDSLHEARRVLIAEGGGTLVTAASDVKIQVEFNPARVGAYRLIGYENRVLAHSDFNDDRKDAGEMGAGHTVTALYEIVPPGVTIDVPGVDPLRYQTVTRPSSAAGSDELMTVKLRYKQPEGGASQLISVPVQDRAGAMTPNLGFAAAVAEFGMLLRRSEHSGSAGWTEALDLARRYRGDDADGYRAEFVRLVELAAALDGQARADGRR